MMPAKASQPPREANVAPGSREKVLSAIRRAIRVPAPRPGSGAHGSGAHGSGAHGDAASGKAGVVTRFESTLPMVGSDTASASRAWLPQVGEAPGEWIELFAANSVDLRTSFVRVASRDELGERLRELSQAEGWSRIGFHEAPLPRFALQELALPGVSTDGDYDRHDLERCEAGITSCEALVAQTGSVVITNRTNGGRVLSILPPHHIVLATRDQMLPDLPAAFELLEDRFGADYPSLMGLITGPSRTGDIERILVLGAHGPKKLSVFLLEE